MLGAVLGPLGDVLPEPFSAPYMQRALLELVLLAVLGGLLGSWIVLRRLAFYTHSVGTAAFPGLVVAEEIGAVPQAAALVTGFGFAVGVERLAATKRIGTDAATGLLLVGALAVGIVLASDVFASGAGVDRLLFGTLIGLSDTDLALTGAMAVIAVLASAGLHRAWLATGFDADGARALGIRVGAADWALLALVAAAVIVSLAAVGALLVIAVMVLPAATARLVTNDVRTLQGAAVALALVEGVVALVIANEANVGPGSALAVIGGAVFTVVAVSRWVAA